MTIYLVIITHQFMYHLPIYNLPFTICMSFRSRGKPLCLLRIHPLCVRRLMETTHDNVRRKENDDNVFSPAFQL